MTDTVEAEKRLREHNQALEDAARLRTQFIPLGVVRVALPPQQVVGAMRRPSPWCFRAAQ